MNFPDSSSRQELYEAFADYTDRFIDQITDTFAQWIGGSFTTKKLNPNDIDLLTILPKKVFEENERLLQEEFKSKFSDNRLIDSYFLPVRETNDPKFALYKSDYVYWLFQFSTSRKDRFGKTHPRGFVEIVYNDFKYE
ncbi:MAG: hypothetical protein AAGG68_07460 [Bacteroidota bacterium]